MNNPMPVLAAKTALFLLLAVTAGCATGNVAGVMRTQAPTMDMIDGLSTVILQKPKDDVGVVERDLGLLVPFVYAFGAKLSVDEGDAGQQIRLARWNSSGLGLVYQTAETAIWGGNGKLLYHIATEAAAFGWLYRSTHHDVYPNDGAPRQGETTDMLLGLVSFGHDDQQRFHLRVFGLQVMG